MKLRPWLLLILLLTALVANAEVYKWVDEQGNVHYGDVPPGGTPAEPLQLPGLSTYRDRTPAPATEPAKPAPAPFAGYTKVAIVQPEPGSAVRANDQRVAVSVALEPPLQPGHAVVILLDGNPVGAPYAGTAVELSGVYRGEHSLQARIVDANGKQLAESATITFTLRQVSTIKPVGLGHAAAPPLASARSLNPPAAP